MPKPKKQPEWENLNTKLNEMAFAFKSEKAFYEVKSVVLYEAKEISKALLANQRQKIGKQLKKVRLDCKTCDGWNKRLDKLLNEL